MCLTITKTYGNQSALTIQTKVLVEVDVTDVFEEYLKKVDDEVCSRLNRPLNCSLVRKKLVSLASNLWDTNKIQLPKPQAIQLLDGVIPSQLNIKDSWTYAILYQGLLIDFTWTNSEEVIEFSHQRLGEYLMACYLIENRIKSNITNLLKEPPKHPRYRDVFEMVAILLPKNKEVKSHLFQLIKIPSETQDSSQEPALFEMSPRFIDSDSTQWLKRRFFNTQIVNKRIILQKLYYSACFPDYPFNANFTDELLRALSLTDRDLIWSEWLRRERRNPLEDIEYFEKACKEHGIDEEKAKRLELIAKLCSWFLTSTDRGMRDKATKALYWFGRRFPEKLFELTINSLSVNDPYIPERMLAASYGVIMALQSGRRNAYYLRRILPRYAKELFETIFKKGCPHSTTHILMRDYARHSIEVALLHQASLLNADELKRIKPPFLDGGIRKWGKSKDRNEGEYREGNNPMGWDFSNYTLGHLVPDRSNYDFQHKGYLTVKANMFWRVYKLGYSLNRFGEIDKEIDRYNWFFRNGNKIDRYGKKYCWIPFTKSRDTEKTKA